MSQTKMTFTSFLAVESFFPSVSWTYSTSTFCITLGQYSLRVWLLTISTCWITHRFQVHLVRFHLAGSPGSGHITKIPQTFIRMWHPAVGESWELSSFVRGLTGGYCKSVFGDIVRLTFNFTARAHQTGGSKYSWSKTHTVDLAKWFIQLELVALYTVTCVFCYFCFNFRYISMCGCGYVSCLGWFSCL